MPPAFRATMIERRRHPRFQSAEPARIVFNSRALLTCIIRDTSIAGACLEVSSEATVPDTFDLIPKSSDAHVCRVVWRIDRRVGVAFHA
jgi:hypothetical protein